MVATLTVDIGGTKCAVALTDENGVHNLRAWPTAGSLDNLDKVVEFFAETVDRDGERPVAVGVCFGGPVDHATATVKRSVHVPGWQGFNFETWAREVFGLPAAVDNDAKVGAVTEFHHGGHATENLAYFTLSTGIGSGVFCDGRLVRGSSNEAGEIGHTRVSDDTRVCSCGRSGCLERLCSGYWLEQDYGKPAAELLADDSFLHDYSLTLARGMATAVLAYNPSVIVVGGGISRVGARLTAALSPALEDELGSWSHLLPSIVTSRFDREGVHIGARELARDLFR